MKLNYELGMGYIFERILESTPNKDALIYKDWHISYKELNEYINEFANYLLDKGITKGDKVALIAKNSPDFLIVQFACFRIGAIVFPLNWRLKSDELIELLQRCDVKHTVVRLDDDKTIEEISNKIENVTVIHENKEDLFRIINGYSSIIEKFDINNDSLCCFAATSGTTGKSKIVMHTHYTLMKTTETFFEAAKFSSSDKLLATSQLFHISVLFTWGTLACGGTSYILDSFNIKDIVNMIFVERINTISIIPSTLKYIIREIKNNKKENCPVKKIIFSACPMPYALLKESTEVFDCDYIGAYGTTETAGELSMLMFNSSKIIEEDKLYSIGQAVKGVEIKIVDENGNECPENVIGEIIAKTPCLMKGYYKDEAMTNEKIVNGFYHTGDKGKYKDGYYYLVGRKDDLIISGGENIYPMEITNMIMNIPDINETVSIGIPDDKWGEHVRTYVVLNKGSLLKEQDIIEYCRANLAHYKCPKEVLFVDSIPKNENGKPKIAELINIK